MSYAMMQALRTPDLTPSEQCIFAYLVGRANGARVCWEKINVIQRELHISTRHTVCSATRKLVKMGRLAVKRRMRLENCYTILDPDGWLYERPEPKVNGKSYPQAAVLSEQKTAHLNGHQPPLSEQKTAHQAPLSGQKPADGRAKNHTTDVQKTAQESSFKNLPREESRQNFSNSFLAESKQEPGGEVVAQPEAPEVDRSLDGLSPLIAAIAQRNGWGADPQAPVVEPPPPSPSASPDPEPVEAETRTPQQIANALGRSFDANPFVRKVTRNQQVEQLEASAPTRRPVKAFHLTPEQRALAYGGLGISPVEPQRVRQREYA